VIVDDLVKNPGLWLAVEDDTGIVISSRVRLARNIRGVAFPGWAGENERAELCDRVREALARIPPVAKPLFLDMEALDAVDKEVLLERHLVSQEMVEKGRGSGLVVSADEGTAVMINEEDHLRLQAISPGLNLAMVWERINEVDSELEQHLEYAYDSRLGYLTSCPSNVGTGLRASVMLHLSGLRLSEELGPVLKGLDKLGLAVRGLLGEGSDAHGNIFQISNQSTLGETEETIVAHLGTIAEEVASHEANARARLLEGRRTYLLDQVARAFGVLREARILCSKEAVDLLAGLRLGVELGMVQGITLAEINEIMLLTQPGHLQKISSRTIGVEERDELRASLVRERIAGIAVSE
jgi:protein arginine kinase